MDITFLADSTTLIFTGFAIALTLLIVSFIQYYNAQVKAQTFERIKAGARPQAVQRDQPIRRVRHVVSRRTAARKDSDEEDDEHHDEAGEDGAKLGKKKALKQQLKEEKKAQREAEIEARRERDERQAEKDLKRSEKQAAREARELQKEEEERREREERERLEHEAYLAMKAEFCVEEEGEDETAGDTLGAENKLEQFVQHIKSSKVMLLEELAAQFRLRTQDCISRIKSLEMDGRLTGVFDDRGKYIYITTAELEAVAGFIARRGRVSLTELAEHSNRLIRMFPDEVPSDEESIQETIEAQLSPSASDKLRQQVQLLGATLFTMDDLYDARFTLHRLDML